MIFQGVDQGWGVGCFHIFILYVGLSNEMNFYIIGGFQIFFSWGGAGERSHRKTGLLWGGGGYFYAFSGIFLISLP